MSYRIVFFLTVLVATVSGQQDSTYLTMATSEWVPYLRDYLHYKETIVEVYPAHQRISLHLGVSRKLSNHAEILRDFNRSPEKPKMEGTIDTLHLKYGFM